MKWLTGLTFILALTSAQAAYIQYATPLFAFAKIRDPQGGSPDHVLYEIDQNGQAKTVTNFKGQTYSPETALLLRKNLSPLIFVESLGMLDMNFGQGGVFNRNILGLQNGNVSAMTANLSHSKVYVATDQNVIFEIDDSGRPSKIISRHSPAWIDPQTHGTITRLRAINNYFLSADTRYNRAGHSRAVAIFNVSNPTKKARIESLETADFQKLAKVTGWSQVYDHYVGQEGFWTLLKGVHNRQIVYRLVYQRTDRPGAGSFMTDFPGLNDNKLKQMQILDGHFSRGDSVLVMNHTGAVSHIMYGSKPNFLKENYGPGSLLPKVNPSAIMSYQLFYPNRQITSGASMAAWQNKINQGHTNTPAKPFVWTPDSNGEVFQKKSTPDEIDSESKEELVDQKNQPVENVQNTVVKTLKEIDYFQATQYFARYQANDRLTLMEVIGLLERRELTSLAQTIRDKELNRMGIERSGDRYAVLSSHTNRGPVIPFTDLVALFVSCNRLLEN